MVIPVIAWIGEDNEGLEWWNEKGKGHIAGAARGDFNTRAFATLYDEYVEPPPSARKKNSAATPATPPHAQLS
eukprot:4676535-Pleurochrysis_carterae.AAC.1